MSDISVGSVASATTNYQSGTTSKTDSAAKSSAETTASEVGAVYEKSVEPDKKSIYSINKMSPEERSALVEQLKQDELERRNQLSSLVSQMISKQGSVSNLAALFAPDKLTEVSLEDIEQAKKDIAEDGYYGVKQTSQRLFDFASALAGDDVDKMKEMQKAMEEGYKKAADAWGGELPDICKDTLAAANKLFDDYYASKAE